MAEQLKSLQEYSRQASQVGRPALYAYDDQGAKLNLEALQVGAQLRIADALERQTKLLTQVHGHVKLPFQFDLSINTSDVEAFLKVADDYARVSVLGGYAKILRREEKKDYTHFLIEMPDANDAFYLGMDWAEFKQKGGQAE
ncbi:hypothetical protein [Hymenobacter sp. BT491]|uniref:hypothetical protein n=1 Tax=Hymenobacter sp. BT491 TaxID=2766779 RepID=UPI001653CF12|nr:hypothetical protein [Hymenobacter sp. BT491]MBC6988546.1 hypothetical protein [Hymenobacter sp. BT491]